MPVVYVTAYSDRRTVDMAKGTEHDGYILRPFHRRELDSIIEVAMKRHAVRTKEKETIGGDPEEPTSTKK